VAVTIAIAIAISVVIADSITIAIAIAHHCCRRPLPLWSPSTIATAISVALPSAITVAVAIAIAIALAIGHCRLRHHWPLQLPSLLAITVTVAVGHFQELLPWCGKNCIQPIKAKNAHLILFCLDSGRCTDQSRMTDQVSGSNGQHQHWQQAVSSERLVREVAGSRGAAGGQQGGDVD
jgi:hypothetical protein